MAGHTVGVDVGGTKVAAALVDDAGEPSCVGAAPRPSRPTTRGWSTGSSRLSPRCATDVDVSGVGTRDRRQRCGRRVTRPVLAAPAAGGGAIGRKIFDRRSRCRCADRQRRERGRVGGARTRSRARGATEMLFVALGTGLGAGLVLRNELYRGYQGFAGEAGHLTVVIDGRACPVRCSRMLGALCQRHGARRALRRAGWRSGGGRTRDHEGRSRSRVIRLRSAALPTSVSGSAVVWRAWWRSSTPRSSSLAEESASPATCCSHPARTAAGRVGDRRGSASTARRRSRPARERGGGRRGRDAGSASTPCVARRHSP